KLLWDLVSQIKVGQGGHAYVVDGEGRLIAHPDISRVLRNTDLSHLAQVRAAEAGQAVEPVAENADGRKVLTAYAPITPPGWLMFVELTLEEAYAPLYAAIWRSGLLLLAALALAVLAGLALARRMVVPIQALAAGAARIGGGDLGQRLSIRTGDEVEALANEFNVMAGRPQETHAGLREKGEVRTPELEDHPQPQHPAADASQDRIPPPPH